MLFSSFSFIFHFLPLVFGGMLLLYRFNYQRFIPGWLIASSIYYYSAVQLWHLLVLFLMLIINYFISKEIYQSKRAKFWLWVGIGIDISILVWFKYAHTLSFLPKEYIPDTLPLGISFYTFQLIAYIVDIYRSKITPAKPIEYIFFILFFPQLIAGPIVHYLQIAPQLREYAKKRCCEYIDTGVLFFIIGLAKKVYLADTFAIFADKAFHIVEIGKHITFLDAWSGLFAYSMQIYFDFCAYSEMAIGLGLIFGIRLPINFLSPYKAESFRDFWRRWHITLSLFLRDYLYIPLGGSRRGKSKTLFNLIFVMTLAGAWHGSGWTFVLWGLGHGILLAINHLLSSIKLLSLKILKPLKIVVTFLIVTLLWVLFRSPSIHIAIDYYKSLFDFSKISFHIEHNFLKFLYHYEQNSWLWIAFGFIIVWLFPNLKRVANYSEDWTTPLKAQSFWLGLFAGVVLWISLKMMSGGADRSFIYFMF